MRQRRRYASRLSANSSRLLAVAGLCLGLPFANPGAAIALGQDTGIFRCPQADGTVAFQGMPCDEPSETEEAAAPESEADEEAGGDAATAADSRWDFDNPYDRPAAAELVPAADEPTERSAERVACEQTTRDAIDAIDLEMRRGFTEAEGEAYLAELLELTQALRACKTL